MRTLALFAIVGIFSGLLVLTAKAQIQVNIPAYAASTQVETAIRG